MKLRSLLLIYEWITGRLLLDELLSFVSSKFNRLSKGALPDGMYLFDAYVLVPEKDNIKNDQQYLAVKVKDGTVSVYWQNR